MTASNGWRDRAACRDTTDPETFFPTAVDGPVYEAQVAVAKTVCAGCTVRAECLAEALVRIPYGIAGGLTPEERRGRHPQPSSTAAALQRGLQPGAGRREVEAAGLVLLIAGRPITEVARKCGVTARTAGRWLARHQAEESHGGHRAPLLTSHTHSTQAGTPTQEEDRS